MSTTRTDAGLELDLNLQQMPAHSGALARGRLYGAVSEIVIFPPSLDRLRKWSLSLDGLADLQPVLRAGVALLKKAVEGCVEDNSSHRNTWREYRKLFEPESRTHVSLYASTYCDPVQFAEICPETCPHEAGKPCPFGDFPCVERFGAPCDHFGAALGSAGTLWVGEACAQTSFDRAVAQRRRIHYAQAHLRPWVGRIADEILLRAKTPLYQAQALSVGALIQSE